MGRGVNTKQPARDIPWYLFENNTRFRCIQFDTFVQQIPNNIETSSNIPIIQIEILDNLPSYDKWYSPRRERNYVRYIYLHIIYSNSNVLWTLYFKNNVPSLSQG